MRFRSYIELMKLRIGFLIALWSGSRALNVFVDTITIMYGLEGHRGIVRTRLLSFVLYLVALVVGAVVLPLMVAGPDAVRGLLHKLQPAPDPRPVRIGQTLLIIEPAVRVRHIRH